MIYAVNFKRRDGETYKIATFEYFPTSPAVVERITAQCDSAMTKGSASGPNKEHGAVKQRRQRSPLDKMYFGNPQWMQQTVDAPTFGPRGAAVTTPSIFRCGVTSETQGQEAGESTTRKIWPIISKDRPPQRGC